MGKPSTQTTDGINYVPKEIRGLLNDYQAHPDDLSARQAIFSKLYNGGGDQHFVPALHMQSSSREYPGFVL